MEKPRYDVFLSHATADKPVVEELARILKKRGFEPWLDKWNLIPGEPWQEAIEKALEDCAACAVCLGPSGTGPWQNEEMRAAIDARVSDRSRQFRVIPVLLPGSERGEPSRYPAFLRATTWVEFRETLDDEKALHRLISGIRGLPPGPDPGEAVAEGACPYRGLQVFDLGDALFFFGREALTEWLLDKLRADRSGSRFLAIVGPSGSGKSSLARAGLLASLKRGAIPGSDTWPIAVCKPGAQPLESLAVALSGAARLGDSPSAIRDLIRDLGTDPRMLHLTTRLSLRDATADRRFVVLVDQFEEVFTLCPDETQRRAIIDNLLHAATMADGQTVVVLTLRADFYGRCAAYPDLAAAVSDRQSLVGPMTHEELRSAIERPAYLAGCELEGGLADLLLNEVESQLGSLPLLEHALLQIWQRREGGRRLTIDAYREIGGVAGALEKHAEEVYAGFSEEEKETCRQIFLRLVQVDEQGRATKRRLDLDELAPAASPVETVVSRLTNARLLTTDQEKQPTVEVAHEALLNNWNRLKQWIEQDREALRARRRLDEAVVEWLGKNRNPSFLLEGGRLAQVEEWAESHAGEMGPDARELLAASIAGRDRERQRELDRAKALEEEQRRRADAEHQRAEEQRRAGRRFKYLSVGLIGILVVAFLAGGIAFIQWQKSEKQRRIALASQLSERSQTTFPSNPQLSLLLATQALKIAKDAEEPYLPEAQSSLRWILARSGGIPLPSGPVVTLRPTADRRRLVALGRDFHFRLWDLEENNLLASGRDLGKMPVPSLYPIYSIDSSAHWFIAAGIGGSQLLDLKVPGATLSSSISLEGEDWPRASQPLSRNGRWLATRKDSSLILRDLQSSRPQQVQMPQVHDIESFTFSPDSLMLATFSGDGTVKLWDLMSPSAAKAIIPLPAGDFPRLAFSKDSQTLIVVKEELPITIWTVNRSGVAQKGSPIQGCALLREIAPFGHASFLCKNSAGSSLWSIKPQGDLEKEATWLFDARLIDFSPDGLWSAIGDSGGNVYLQSTAGLKGPIAGFFTTQALPLRSLLFSSSSGRLVTHGDNEVPRLWTLREVIENASFEPHVYRILTATDPVINARNEILHEGPSGNQLRFWAFDGKPLTQVLPGSENASPLRAVSADGQWCAAAQEGRGLLLWHIGQDGRVSQPFSLDVNANLKVLQLSQDGHWLAAGDSIASNFLWNLNNLQAPPFPLTNGPTTAFAFSPVDDFVASGETSPVVRLRFLGQRGPRLADVPNSPKTSVRPKALAFSLDGQWLAIGGQEGQIHVWKISGGDVFLESRTNQVRSLAFSPDGKWLAAGGQDGTIQLWRWAGERTASTPILLTGHTKAVYSVVFTSQGLVSAGEDHTVRLWELQPNKLIKLACQSAGRTLSRREWATYLLSEPYQEREPCPEFPQAFD